MNKKLDNKDGKMTEQQHMNWNNIFQKWKGVIIGCTMTSVIITIVFQMIRIYPNDFLSGLSHFLIPALGGAIAVFITKTNKIEQTVFIGFFTGVLVGSYIVTYKFMNLIFYTNIITPQSLLMKEIIETYYPPFNFMVEIVYTFCFFISLNIFSGIIVHFLKRNKGKV